MKRFLLPAGAISLAAVAPGVASAKPPTAAHAHAYERAYHQVARHLGTATGRYQITPSTEAAYGCDLSTPGGQDACAQTIYQHQGAGAWVGCGG